MTATGCIRYGVLGPLEVRLDDVLVELGGRRQRLVLLRLLAAEGEPVSLDRLVEDLWADDPPPGAPGTVQSYVSHLRRLLEPGRRAREPAGRLVTRASGYAVLAAPPERDDVDFATRFEDATRQLHRGDMAAAYARSTAALGLWRGPAYPEAADEPWGATVASRLQQLRAAAIELRAAAGVSIGRAVEAVGELEALLAEHPYREHGWAILMAGLYLSGRAADAVRAGQRARLILADELGMEPGALLRSAEDAVLVHDEARLRHLLRPVPPASTAEGPQTDPPTWSGAPRRRPPPVGLDLPGAGVATADPPAAPAATAHPGDAGAGSTNPSRFEVPPLGPHHVVRQRLHDLLEDAVEHRVVVMSAPAGSGKTAALTGWACRRVGRVGWYGLEVDDGDPAVFWPSLAAALGLREPRQVRGARELAAALGEERGHRVVVLDDYHVLANPQLHDEMAWLVSHVPPRVCMVIATRHDPPLPLARLRAAGALREVRFEDLRFDRHDLASLLDGMTGVNLPAADVVRLAERTEGWAVGVQLAALSLAHQEDHATFLAEFGGDDRHVADYLREEILARLPDELREFLFDTAILDRLSAPLCEAVTGRPGAQEALEEIERRNLFLVALDHRRRWYRYHHLFAEWLRISRNEGDSDRHRRAARWFRDHDFAGDAVRHHVAAGDVELAAEVIEQQRWRLVGQARQATLREWIQLLPPHVLRRRLRLALTAAWVAYDQGRWDDVEHLVRVLTDGAGWGDEEDAALLEAEVALLQAGRLAALGRLAEAGAIAEGALSLVAVDEARARTGLLLVLGKSRLAAGELSAARSTFAEARRLAEPRGLTVVELIARAHLAEVDRRDGPPGAGLQASGEAVQFARDTGLAEHPECGVAHLTLANALLDEGRVAEADEHLRRGEELATRIPYEPRRQAAAATRARLMPRQPGPTPTPPAPGEALTRQERALLQLLPSTLAMREIAGELYLSLNTVKTHARGLYRKLGVQTRHGAIEEARRRSLL